jgi:pentatricopeptide repeat protein
MRKNFNFRLSTLTDRPRRRNHRRHNFYEREFVVGTATRCSWWTRTDDCNHGRYFTTKIISTREPPALSYPHRIRNDATPLLGRSHSHLAITTGISSTHQSPGRQRLSNKPSSNFFSSTAPGNHAIGWNARVEEFLARTLAYSNTVPSVLEDSPTIAENEQLRPGEVAETLQALLDDLLEITAAAIAMQKGEFPKYVASHDTQTQVYNNNNNNDDESNQYLDWISLSPYASTSSEDNESSQPHTAVQNNTDEAIEVGLAFALMDRLVALEQADDSTLINHTLEWTAHTSCLNPILQLWKQSYSPLSTNDSNFQQAPASASAFTPSEVLAKLDTYRQHSNLLIPDVQSYNTIMDAVATYNNSTSRKNQKSRSTKGKSKSVVDIDFCQSLWEWMWKESKQDSLVRPDGITLRIMLKANVFTGHVLAAQRCEALVDEWAKYHNSNSQPNDSDKSQKHDGDQQTINDPRGTLLQSLIHVWALHDPLIAESYLKELARRYLSGESQNPPDTIAWNRVISAYAIAYNQPGKGLEVLEDFWEFYRQAHGLNNTTSTTITASADLENSADTGSINTKSNSLKLSNAIAVSSSKDVSGITENLSSALDSAIWKVHQPNLQTYNALLEGYARQNNVRQANKIFDRVQNATSMSPNIATYTSAIKANGRDLEKVKDLVQQCIAAYEAQEHQEKRSDEEEWDKSILKHISLDRPFFHAWLHACANAENIKDAKKVIKQMKALNLTPNATTYRILIEVFLSRQDSQGAIEWLLAYAKLEGMSESAIVSCTTYLLKWYRCDDHSPGSGDVDAIVLLQILCENGFITQEESLQQLLLGISPNQAKAVLGWLRRKEDGTSLKMWAIAMRALAQEGSDAPEVEDLFLQLQHEPSWAEKFDQNNGSVFDDEEEKLVVEMYSSIIVAWSKQGNLNRRLKRRIQHWKNELSKYQEGALSLNLAAQVALVTMYSEAGDPLSCEQYVNDLFRDYDEGKIVSPPDTIMCNMVLNAWAKKSNGLRAASFFEERIKEPDAVSYNTVINAFARQGQLESAEEWACKLIALFIENPVEFRRPEQATFTVLLAAWRRSKNPNAAERAEKILRQMHQLYENDILLIKPNFKSYQTVLDTWEKSSQLDAAQKAEEFLLSSSDYKTDKRLVKKVRYIKSRHEKRNRRLQKENEL